MRCAWRHVLHSPGQLTDMGAACLPSRSIDVRMPRRRQTPLCFQAQPHSSRPVVRAGRDRSAWRPAARAPCHLPADAARFRAAPLRRAGSRSHRPARGSRADQSGADRPVLQRVHRGHEQQQGARDLQRHRRIDRPRGRWLQHPDAFQRQPAGDPDHQPDRERGRRRRIRRGTVGGQRDHPRPGRPDERIRLVQWRRRGRPAQGHNRARRHRPDRI